MESRPIINRVLVSLITALSFVAMSLSGIAAFIVPQGKVAYWTNWTFMGLSKTQWGNIHITTSVLFLIAGIWHTCYNWTPLVQYLRGIPGRMTASWRDLAIATVVTVFFTVGGVTKTPPLNYIISFNNWIKESWVRTPADDPPFGHAELLSLKGFCKKMSIDPTSALAQLRQSGMVVRDGDMTLDQIAKANRCTPSNVYQIIRKLEQPDTVVQPAGAAAVSPAVSTVTGRASADSGKKLSVKQPVPVAEKQLYTGDLVIERFEGKGIGRKTFVEICNELNLDIAHIRKKLMEQKLTVKDDETLKEAASRLKVMPIELLKTILVGEPL